MSNAEARSSPARQQRSASSRFYLEKMVHRRTLLVCSRLFTTDRTTAARLYMFKWQHLETQTSLLVRVRTVRDGRSASPFTLHLASNLQSHLLQQYVKSGVFGGGLQGQLASVPAHPRCRHKEMRLLTLLRICSLGTTFYPPNFADPWTPTPSLRGCWLSLGTPTPSTCGMQIRTPALTASLAGL